MTETYACEIILILMTAVAVNEPGWDTGGEAELTIQLLVALETLTFDTTHSS